MPRRALVERRPWLLGSLVLAFAYYVLKDAAFPGVYLYVLQVGALALLSAYAMLRLGGSDGRMLAAIAALAGTGVAAVELWFLSGVVILMLGHGLAISLFVKHRREDMAATQKAAAVALLFLVPLICWRLPFDREQAVTTGIYGLSLGAMAATGWASLFPRYRVGAGGILLVLVSVVSIAQSGPLMDVTWPGVVAWPVYFLGYFLISTGVTQTLRGELKAQA